MRTFAKLIIFIIILIIAGLIALPFLINPNDYKEQISEQVEKATGRQLTLDGDISLSVFPWVAIELGPLSLSNAPGFKADKFAKVDAAEIRIKLLPLLKKQLEMDTIILDGLALHLEKNKAGKTNFDDFSKPTEVVEVKEQSTTDSSESAAPALTGISIAGVQLTNANVMWTDASTSQTIQLENLNLTTDALVAGESTQLDLAFKVRSDNPQAKITVALTSDVMVDVEKQLYQLNGLNLNTQIESPALPSGKAELTLDTNINADMERETISISDLALEVYDVMLNANLNASNVQSGNPNFSGTLNINAFNLRDLAKSLAFELPVMSDDSTLKLVAINTDLSGSTNAISLTNLLVNLDQTQLTGGLSVKQFNKPAIKFNLAIDDIDVDRYLPPKTDNAGNETVAKSTQTASSDSLPLEPLRQINAQGTFDIGTLKVSGTHSNTIHITLNAKDGLVKLNPLSANMYDGNYRGNINLDARTSSLKISLDEKINNVQAGPLLKDISGKDTVTGVVNAGVKLTGNGQTVSQIKQTLNGEGQFAFNDGAIKGINIAESIRNAKAVFNKNSFSLPSSSSPLKTDFSTLNGTFTVKNGTINNQDLLAMSPLLRIQGAGDVSLPEETINYGLKVAIVETSTGQAGKELSELKGLTIPIKITGTFSQPKPNVDIGSMLKEGAGAEIKAKAAEKIKEKLGGELGGLLGGVLGESKPSEETPIEQTTGEESEPQSAEDQAKEALKNKLKNLF
jgi:AsmA protein